MIIIKELRKNMINSFYQLKGIGCFAWLPFIVLYLIMPLSHYVVYCFYQDIDELYQQIITDCQLYYPLISVWYVLFVLYHYVEEQGNEILYIEKKSKLLSIMFLYLAYILIMLPLFIIYTQFFSDLWWLYLKICVVSLLYVAIVYATSFLSKKIVVGVVVVLLYTLMTIMEYITDKNNMGYYSGNLRVQTECVKEVAPIFIYASVCLLIGNISNRNLNCYK